MLDKDVRATRTPDRFIKKQPEANVVALPVSEAMDAVRLARAADRSCEEAIRRRLEQEGIVGPANHAGKRDILLENHAMDED